LTLSYVNSDNKCMTIWTPELKVGGDLPLYRALAEAIGAAVERGELAPLGQHDAVAHVGGARVDAEDDHHRCDSARRSGRLPPRLLLSFLP